MNWHFPPGILRCGMCLEHDGYHSHIQTVEQASDERGKRVFPDLANQEEPNGKNRRWRHLLARDKAPT